MAHIGSKMSESQIDDPLGVRADFPLAKKDIYFNTPYMSLIPTVVEKEGHRFVSSKAHGPISLGDMVATTDETRNRFAQMIGADVDEIGFLFATSEGENLVARALDLKRGDNIVVDELHYMTTFVLYKHLENAAGVELRIASSAGGAVPVAAFEPLVDDKTRLLSVAWVSHQNGYRHDMRRLAELAHSRNAYLYTDAIQAVGMFPIDVHAEGIDFLTCGTYKWLLAGYGVAPFYIRRELLDRVPPDRMGHLHVEKELGNHEYQIYRSAKKFEYATLAFGPLYQLCAALGYLAEVGVDRIGQHTVALAAELRKGLVERGFRVLTPQGNRSAIVTFQNEKDQTSVAKLLESERIRVSFREKGAQIRVGMALYNNRAEVQRFLEVLDRIS
jgi:selenocysteine lyase/cysteine desulfurase